MFIHIKVYLEPIIVTYCVLSLFGQVKTAWRKRPKVMLHIYQKFTFNRHHHPVLYPGIFALLYLFTVEKSEVV